MTTPASCIAPPLTLDVLAAYEDMPGHSDITLSAIALCRSVLTVLETSERGASIGCRATPAGSTIEVHPLPPRLNSRMEDIAAMASTLAMVAAPMVAAPLRDAVYHMTWFLGELTCGRWPLTIDQIRTR